jgi:hypothetical protein
MYHSSTSALIQAILCILAALMYQALYQYQLLLDAQSTYSSADSLPDVSIHAFTAPVTVSVLIQ